MEEERRHGQRGPARRDTDNSLADAMVVRFRRESSCLSLLGGRGIACKFSGMEKTYTIIWMTERGDRFGAGQKRFSKDEAESLAMELNQAHPGFIHEAVNTAMTDPREAITALKAS